MGQVVRLGFDKAQIFERLLKNGTVFVLLDATREDVLVPKQFAHNTMLGLNFCYDYGIPDFTFDAYSIRATLSFDEGYFFCEIPWDAIHHMENKA